MTGLNTILLRLGHFCVALFWYSLRILSVTIYFRLISFNLCSLVYNDTRQSRNGPQVPVALTREASEEAT